MSTDIVLTKAERGFFKEVDAEVKTAKQDGDYESLLTYAANLVRGAQITGIALARTLYEASLLYEKNPVVDETSGEVMEFDSYATTVIPRDFQTIRKYRELWENVFMNKAIAPTAGVRNKMMAKPIKNLLRLTAAAKAGQLDGKAEEIIEAKTLGEMQELVREQRGVQTSAKNSIALFIDRNGKQAGALYAKQPKGEFLFLGVLKVDSDDEVVQKAIARIVANSHVQDRN
jgi:hypothetical protein